MKRILRNVFLFFFLAMLLPAMLQLSLPRNASVLVGALAMGLSVIALFRPLPSLGLGHRGISSSVCFAALMLLMPPNGQQAAPNETMAKDISTASVETVASPPIDTFRTFTAKDVVWDKYTKPHREVVLAGVNKLHRENSRCKDIDPGTATRSTKRGTKNNPVFFVTCGEGTQAFNAYFSKSDVVSKKTLVAARHISQGEAVLLCEQYAKAKAAHPGTVDFSKFLDLGVRELGDGRTRVVSSFTAKNSFNMELKYNVTCLLNAKGLIEGHISEAT
ncbi:hypothetical protein [Candidatus Nitronereus thalassa]|uniref:Uncharacterized protein n=1 Tax=Candidatus Nitronereus thalassa TaxID=3020898 RepID=A0ABU3KB11_9BACT|nr:hypothetical protein [Candidatus Nitronereus thalassa]MDT7043670.1 hypothetical protein [Candidatus Nitronereus thalassa]